MIRRAALAAGLGMLLVAHGAAVAQQPAPTPPAEAKQEKKKGGSRKWWKAVELGGRVFFFAIIEDEGDRTTLDEDLASVRLWAKFRPKKWLRAVVEADLASGKAALKDGYLLLRRWGLGARAGQFKPPVSAIELESPWRLPVARRGLVNDVLVDLLQIGGRRPGLQAEWAPACPLAPSVAVGAFQSSLEVGVRYENARPEEHNFAARAAVRPGPVEAGVFAESRQTDRATRDAYLAGGADVKLDAALAGGRQGLRAWADVFVAESPHRAGGKAGTATLVAGRAILAWRLGGRKDGKRYLEPYAMFSAIDPDAGTGHDLVWEAAGGVNLGFWRRARVQVEVEARRTSRNTPPGLLATSGGTTNLADFTAGLVQIGAVF